MPGSSRLGSAVLMVILVCIGCLIIYLLVPIIYTVIKKKEYFTIKLWRFLNRFTLDRIQKLNNGVYGFTLFCGRQGGGKTYCAIEYAVDICKKNKALLVSNTPLTPPADIEYMFIRNINEIRYLPEFPCYVIILDEIQTLFDSHNFDSTFYELFCQLRKRNIKIIGTAQVFERVALKLREQVHQLYFCKTFFGCLTRRREYMPFLNTEGKISPKNSIKLSTKYFIQTDYIRQMYNTFYRI